MWQSAADEFNKETLVRLRQQGLAVGQAALRYDRLALRIIRRHATLLRSFDAMTHELLKQDLSAYELQEQKRNEVREAGPDAGRIERKTR